MPRGSGGSSPATRRRSNSRTVAAPRLTWKPSHALRRVRCPAFLGRGRRFRGLRKANKRPFCRFRPAPSRERPRWGFCWSLHNLRTITAATPAFRYGTRKTCQLLTPYEFLLAACGGRIAALRCRGLRGGHCHGAPATRLPPCFVTRLALATKPYPLRRNAPARLMQY